MRSRRALIALALWLTVVQYAKLCHHPVNLSTKMSALSETTGKHRTLIGSLSLSINYAIIYIKQGKTLICNLTVCSGLRLGIRNIYRLGYFTVAIWPLYIREPSGFYFTFVTLLFMSYRAISQEDKTPTTTTKRHKCTFHFHIFIFTI